MPTPLEDQVSTVGMALLRDRWPAVVAAADLRKMLTEVDKEKPRRNGKIRIR